MINLTSRAIADRYRRFASYSAFTLASVLITGACGSPFDPPVCGPQQRSLSARGVVTASGIQIAANLSVAEFRETPLVSNVGYTVEGGSFKGHVSSLALVRASDPSSILLEMTIASPMIPVIAQGSSRSTSLNGIFDLVHANSTVVTMTIDDPAGTVVVIPLTVLGELPWAETVCGT
jgi:hypothetical protein